MATTKRNLQSSLLRYVAFILTSASRGTHRVHKHTLQQLELIKSITQNHSEMVLQFFITLKMWIFPLSISQTTSWEALLKMKLNIMKVSG